MFVLPSHFSPCTLSIHRPIGGNRASLQELRPALRPTRLEIFSIKIQFYIRKSLRPESPKKIRLQMVKTLRKRAFIETLLLYQGLVFM